MNDRLNGRFVRPAGPANVPSQTEQGWSNWAGNLRFTPQVHHTPGSRQELGALLASLDASGEKVRPVGSGHSWTPLAVTAGHLLHLGRLNRVLEIDLERQEIEVEAGIRLEDLNTSLAEAGLALSTLGSVDKQTLAGAISTATHGSGVGYGSLSSLAQELELVTPAGAMIRCSPDLEPDLFAAAGCSLGSLGVISRARIRCEPAFRLRSEETLLPFDELVDNLGLFADRHEHFKMWWLPHTDQALAITQDRTHLPEAGSPLQRWFERVIVRNALLEAGMASTSRWPQTVPWFQRLLLSLTPQARQSINRSDRAFVFPVNVRHYECEYAVPREHAGAILHKLRRFVLSSGLPIGFIVEVRFVAAEPFFLSPAYGRETAYIGVMQYRRLPFEAYFRGFEAIADEYGGRPHWGKLHTKGYSSLRKLYPAWDRFLGVRAELDPNGTFLNPYLRLLLGV